MEKENWIKEYNNGATSECPFCGTEDAEHTCRNCYLEITKEECFDTQSSFCKKCDYHKKEELPKIIEMQKKNGVVCKCTEADCAKCLLVNCKDDDCYFHPKQKKDNFKSRYNNR